jgi:hypothetical protein
VHLSVGALRAVLLVVGALVVGSYAVAVLGILIDTEHGWDLVVPLVAHAVVTATAGTACLELCGRACDRVAERTSDAGADGAGQAGHTGSHAAG